MAIRREKNARRRVSRAAPQAAPRVAPLAQRVEAFGASLQRGMQSLVSLTALLVLLGLGFLTLEALRSLPVERIVVGGKLEHLRQEAIREALAGELGQGLIFLDLGDLRDRLESLPWVYRAQLRRRYPSTLEVQVVEQLPIARWGEDAFLNHEARVIEVADAQRWQDLPRISGARGSEARLMNHYQRLLEQLRTVSLTPVALREDEFGQLSVRLDAGLELQLGDRDFSLRLRRFIQLWRRELVESPAPIARVDMRYDKGAAVAFDSAEQVAALLQNSGE